MTFWVYILRNPEGGFYIGHTDNLVVRIGSHNRKDKISGKFTRKNGPWELVWSEEHSNRADATRRERQIKSWKSAKLIRERLLATEK
jgi:predicted GIY-YIG superfamily endonuclease